MEDKITFDADNYTFHKKLKNGSLYKSGGRLLYVNKNIFRTYGLIHEDFILDWNARDPGLSNEVKNIVMNIFPIDENTYPVFSKSEGDAGTDYSVIINSPGPPPSEVFDGIGPWCYIDEIKEINYSKKYLPKELIMILEKRLIKINKIHNKIKKIKGNLLDSDEYNELVKEYKNQVLYLKDKKYNKIWSADSKPYFTERFLNVNCSELEIIENPDDEIMKKANPLFPYDYNERGLKPDIPEIKKIYCCSF
jgi:hypothetical protein